MTAAVLAGQLTIGWGNDLVDAERDRQVGRADKPLAHGELSTAAVRLARKAALSDECGKALDRILVQVGAPPRPVVAQPILWSKKRPVTQAAKPG